MQLTGKIGLIGDVHQEDRYLGRALQRLADLGGGTVLCTGDIVDGVGSADACIETLADAGVHTVRGNHDRWFLLGSMRDLPDALPIGGLNHRSRVWLAALPPSLRFTTPRGTLLLCHGLGDGDMATLKPDDEGYALEVNDRLHALVRDPDVDIVVAGHTHCRMVRHFDGLTVVNAGTLLRHQEPGFAVLDLDAAEVVFYGFGAAGIFEVERWSVGGIGGPQRGAGRGRRWGPSTNQTSRSEKRAAAVLDRLVGEAGPSLTRHAFDPVGLTHRAEC